MQKNIFTRLVNTREEGRWMMEEGRDYIDSAIRSLRPMRLKMVISLSSLRIRSVRRTSFNVDPLVVTSSITRTFCWRIIEHSSSSIEFDRTSFYVTESWLIEPVDVAQHVLINLCSVFGHNNNTIMIEINLLVSAIYSSLYGKPNILSTIVLEVKHESFLCIIECYTPIFPLYGIACFTLLHRRLGRLCQYAHQ